MKKGDKIICIKKYEDKLALFGIYEVEQDFTNMVQLKGGSTQYAKTFFYYPNVPMKKGDKIVCINTFALGTGGTFIKGLMMTGLKLFDTYSVGDSVVDTVRFVVDKTVRSFYKWRFLPIEFYQKAMGAVVVPVTTPCPDCKGSGEYIGLVAIETCQTCKGKKVV